MSSRPIELNARIKLDPSAFDLEIKMETPFRNARRQSLSVSGGVMSTTNGFPAVNGSIVISWTPAEQRGNREFRLDLQTQTSKTITDLGDTKEIEFEFSIASPFEFLPSRKVSTKLTIESSYIRYSQKPTFNIQRKPAFNIHLLADWGDGGFTLTTPTKVTGMVNFEVHIGIFSKDDTDRNVYDVQIVNRSVDKRRRMELAIRAQSELVAATKVIYDMRETKNGVEVKGNVEISTAKPIIFVKYGAETKNIDKADESGFEFKFKMDTNVSSILLPESHFFSGSCKTESAFRMTNRETSFTVNAASWKDQSVELALMAKDKSTGSSTNQETYAILRNKNDGVVKAHGFRFKTLSAGMKFEHSGEWIVDEVKGYIIGCKVYRKDGGHGIEISTPQRVVALTLEKIKGPKHLYKYILSTWLDKSNVAEKRLIVTVSFENHKFNDMDGFITSVQMHHPSLPRDLEYRLEWHMGSRQDLLHVKLDMDVFDETHRRWTLESNVKSKLIDKVNRNVTIETEIHSTGTNQSATLVLYGSVKESDASFGANLRFFEPETDDKEMFFYLDANEELSMLRLGTTTKSIVYEARYNLEDVNGQSRVQVTVASRLLTLPVLSLVVDIDSRPRIDIRLFKKSTSRNFYHISGGFSEDNKFMISMARQIGGNRRALFRGYTILNTTNAVLYTGLSWDVEVIQELIQVAHTRFGRVRSELQSNYDMLFKELANVTSKWQVFQSFESDMTAFVDGYSQQWMQMIGDVQHHESFRYADELVAWYVQEIGDKVVHSLNVLTPKVEWNINVQQIFDELTTFWNKFFDRIYDSIEHVMYQAEAYLQKQWSQSGGLYTFISGIL